MTNVMQAADSGKPGDRKAATRQRIVDVAARLFRAHGIDGVGVDAIMREAGLTHGGFYGHFASKETLAAEVCGDSLRHSADRWEATLADAPAAEARRRLVTGYLRPDAVAHGCLLPALGPDIARRQQAQAPATAAIARMAAALDACRPHDTAESGLAALSTLVGAVVLARLSSDPALAEAILAAARASLLDEDAAKT